jgi:hypothetical protein
MSALQIDPIFGRLSGELILVCDDDLTVRDANTLARSTLGERIVGRPLLKLITAMARAKGEAFLDALRSLGDADSTATWELLLHVPRAAPLLTGLRGARRPGGGWVIMGGGESPGLSRLYHEVLSLNAELTDLIRQLTREQAALAATVSRLTQRQEEHHAEHR